MNAVWKDGILFLLQSANEAFAIGGMDGKVVGAQLLVTAIAAQQVVQ